MTYATRSPYSVLPVRADVRRATFPRREEISDAYARHGSPGLRVVLRDVLRPLVEGRARTPTEVRLLRDWHAMTVSDTVAYWRARLDGLHPDGEEEFRSEPGVERVTCSACGSLFERMLGARGRPRTRCYACSPPR